MIPIAEAFDDLRYSTIVGVMGSQMAKTELIFNVLGKRFDDGPYCPALYIGPTQKQVKSVSKDRISKMIRLTKDLYDKLEKGQNDQVTEKYIGGVRLGFGWAGSATELASHPAGLVMVDEYDRMSQDVGGEGDPLILAKARTKNYPNGTVGVFSTPTIEGASQTWSVFDDGTKYMWAWPCPHCADYFVPMLKHLRWPEKATPGQAYQEARVYCPICGGMIENRHKHTMNKNGKYIPHSKPDLDVSEYVPVDEPEPTSIASFWVSGLASPWQSFGQVAEILVSAYRSREPEKIQAAINTYGGETFKTRGDAPKWQEVEAHKLDYAPGDFIEPAQLMVMGCDVQKDGIYYVIRDWGPNLESWLIENGFIFGETEYDEVWDLLDQVVDREFHGRRIRRVFIDSGYRPGDKAKRPENQIYLYCRRHPGTVFPTKGHDTQDRPLKSNKIDVTLSGKVYKGGLTLWHLDTDYLKTWIYSRIKPSENHPSLWHLHREIEPDYCKQMVAEELVVKSSGRRIWIRRNRDNHYLDAEANATAAAISLQVHALKPPDPDKPDQDPDHGKERKNVIRSGRNGKPFIRGRR